MAESWEEILIHKSTLGITKKQALTSNKGEGVQISLKLRPHAPLDISSAHWFLYLEFSSLQMSTAVLTHIPLRSHVYSCLQEPIVRMIHPKKAIWSWSQI